jgi:alpha-D-ribose 1-methylphosphonate 5-triphosphate synthase subunit PhnH
MPLFGRDTSPEAARFLVEGYRRMSPEQKFAIVDDLTRATRQLAAARIRQQYPEATDREVLLRVASLTLGRDLMIRAFGWDPEREGR